MGRGMYGQNMGMSSGDGLFHAVAGFLWLVILIALVVILVRWAMRGGRRGHGQWMHMMHGQGSAMELLKERYVKGEIDKKEFEEKKRDLTV
jgi:putative membrane protein